MTGGGLPGVQSAGLRPVVLTLATFLGLLQASCSSVSMLGNLEHSDLFSQIQPGRILQETAAELGLKLVGSGSSFGSGGESGHWKFGYVFAGDGEARAKLMDLTKASIEQEMAVAGMEIHGRTSWGILDGFQFRYSAGAASGTLSIYSAVTAEGIEISGSMEEHREPWLH